jgi:flagellar protein FliT
MSGYEHILDTYRNIAAKTTQMVDAAESGDWKRLITLEKDCRALAEDLKRADQGTAPGDSAYLQRKVELIRQIMGNDARIRQFTEPWMNRLMSYLGNARQQHRLCNAYRSEA